MADFLDHQEISNSSCWNSSSSCHNQTIEDNHVTLDADFTLQIFYLVIGFVGMFGNALVAMVILAVRHLRKNTTNIFICNQSAIDFCASLFIVLTSFIRNVDVVKSHIAREMFCRLWKTNFPIWGLFVSSTYNLVAITLERQSAIVNPLRHTAQFSKTKSRSTLVVVWLSGLVYNAAYMVPTSAFKDGDCTAFTEWPSAVVQQFVGLLTVVLQYVVPLTIISVAYIRIAISLRRGLSTPKTGDEHPTPATAQEDRRAKRMRRARRNIIKTLLTVSLSFVLCWSPNQIFYTMFNLGVSLNFNGAFYHFTVIAVFLNSCINPFIYALQYDQFKNVIFKSCLRNKDSSADVSEVSTVSSGVHHESSTKSRGPTSEDHSKGEKAVEFDNVAFQDD